MENHYERITPKPDYSLAAGR